MLALTAPLKSTSTIVIDAPAAPDMPALMAKLTDTATASVVTIVSSSASTNSEPLTASTSDPFRIDAAVTLEEVTRAIAPVPLPASDKPPLPANDTAAALVLTSMVPVDSAVRRTSPDAALTAESSTMALVFVL